MNEISYSYVALLDILGYKNHLERDRDSGRLDFQGAMLEALNVFNSVNQIDFGFTAISDTIIVTCSQKDHIVKFLQLLKDVQISFLRQKLFIRGAVVYAQHFHSGHLTYSPALSRAHELEQKTAIYPRIVIDKNIVEMFAFTDSESALRESNLIIEWNTIFFINILDKNNWLQIYTDCKSMFNSEEVGLAGQESAFSKHVWFENYLFASVSAKKRKARYIPKPDLFAEYFPI